jgi:hypothetical protein
MSAQSGYISLHPSIVFVLAFFGLWLAAWLGARYRRGRRFGQDDRQDFALILASTLTLLGLLIGFSFSMAATRYDQRKNLEEAEANAVGTEYLRADLLDAPERDKMRTELRRYAELRIRYYVADQHEVDGINAETTRLQNAMWPTVSAAAKRRPDPVMALVASGMNDVINSQGYTQAAWSNRIPISAVILMAAIAVGCNLLVGYGSPSVSPRSFLLVVLPLLVALALTLIADIDTPRHGVIQVSPNNLTTLLESLRSS